MALLKNILLILLLVLSSFPLSDALTDIAPGHTTYANSSGIGVSPSWAIDRNLATSWTPSGATAGWWGINLSHSYYISDINFSSGGNQVDDMYINGSNDNSTWTILYHNATWNTQNEALIPINANYQFINVSMNGALAIIVEIYIYSNAPNLISPSNGSSQTITFPPLTTTINFTWTADNSGLSSNLVVAKDVNFNLIEADTTTTNNYSSQSLESGIHYWKVRFYNSTNSSYSNYSDYFYFTITGASSATGAGIDGIVYSLNNGVQTPLSGATVFIYNNSFSSQTTTGSNGYYLFTGLVNGSIYNLKASLKDFQTSEIATVNVSGITTYNIQLKPTEPAWFEADKQYILFKARWLYCLTYCDIPGATITVYKYGEVIPVVVGAESNPKVTDTSGSASFLLFKTQRYRVTIENATAGISQTMDLYPKDTNYIWLITNTNTRLQDHPILESQAIQINVSKSIINATNATITVSYNDTLNSTSNLTIYLNQSNSSIAVFTTIGNGSHVFSIANYSGQSYFVHIVANSSIYGTIDDTYSVMFEKSSVGVSGIPEELWLWFMIGIMFFTGAIFTASTVELGLIIVCAEGWIGLAAGAFSTINTTQFGIGLTLVSVIAIMAYINVQQKKEGY